MRRGRQAGSRRRLIEQHHHQAHSTQQCPLSPSLSSSRRQGGHLPSRANLLHLDSLVLMLLLHQHLLLLLDNGLHGRGAVEALEHVLGGVVLCLFRALAVVPVRRLGEEDGPDVDVDGPRRAASCRHDEASARQQNLKRICMIGRRRGCGCGGVGGEETDVPMRCQVLDRQLAVWSMYWTLAVLGRPGMWEWGDGG